MQRRIWLKPDRDRHKVFENDYFQCNISPKGIASLTEQIYLDTADMDLARSGAVYLISCRPEGICQMVVFENPGDDIDAIHTTELPAKFADISSFPESVSNRLQVAIADKPLLLQFSSVFIEKSRAISFDDGSQYRLVRSLGHFKDDDIRGELCAFELTSTINNDTGLNSFAERLISMARLSRCAPPWFDAMRIKDAGMHPAISAKLLKKHAATQVSAMFSVRIFELIRAYLSLVNPGFKNDDLQKLNVEARKTQSLIEVFQDTSVVKNSSAHRAFLDSFLSETDQACHSVMLDDELGMISSLHPWLDFKGLQEKLNRQSQDMKDQLQAKCQRGEYSAGLIALWIDIHQIRLDDANDAANVQATLDRVKNWIHQLNLFKRSSISDFSQSQDYLTTARKIRYVMDEMEHFLPKKLLKITPALKKLEVEFEVLCEINQCIILLDRLAKISTDPELSYTCGIGSGIFSLCLQDTHEDCATVWREYRNLFRGAEEIQ